MEPEELVPAAAGGAFGKHAVRAGRTRVTAGGGLQVMRAGTELVELGADPMAGGASDGHVGGVSEFLAEQHGIGQGVYELPQ